MSNLTPEQYARQQIDAQLAACGWVVQDYKQFNPSAGRGIALREAPLKSGTCDYLLLVDRKAVGVIEREVALLNRDKLNVGLTAFVAIRTNTHSPQWLARFAEAVRDIPEIVECYRMSGETDYMLRVVIPDVKAFDGVYNSLIQKIELYDVTTSFAMEDLKFSTALPLDYVRT